MVTKEHILAEIRRTAEANSGIALGIIAFTRETGMRESDWRGVYWARWSDAVREAGLGPRAWQGRKDDDEAIGRMASFVRDLGRFPTGTEFELRHAQDPNFPTERIVRRIGNTKKKLAGRILAFCRARPDFADVEEACRPIAEAPERREADTVSPEDEKGWGFVYLAGTGRRGRYKVGKANHVGLREGQLKRLLPEIRMVHYFRTDDPYGIEAYWKNRWHERRVAGTEETFDLSPTDVADFRRRKSFM